MRDKYTNEPIDVDAQTWFYEEPGGLLMVREFRGKNKEFLQTEQFKVPWRLLRTSVEVHNRVRAKGKKP